MPPAYAPLTENSRRPSRPAVSGLFDKLVTELPGILAWAVAGCQEWLKHGLEPPGAVKEATLELQRENDPLAAFLLSCCRIEQGASTSTSALWNQYEAWAAAEGLTDKEKLRRLGFISRLKGRGFRLTRLGSGSILRGLTLVAPPGGESNY